MQIGNIRTGDVIKVDIGGRVFFGQVTGTREDEERVVTFDPISHGAFYYSAKPRQVVAHYRKSKASLR
jgi:hypothetical protein